MSFILSLVTWIDAFSTQVANDYLFASSISCALVTFSIATYWFAKLTEAGVGGATLVAAMTTTRAIAATWMLLRLAAGLIALGALLGLVDIAGASRRPYSDALNALGSLVGPVTLIALASNGYTEYRRALEEVTLPSAKQANEHK